ncbi:MAG: GYD domain-containing protein [Candidatus Thermoplasmatota archaeon]|nr:GYD domain-containing protein [Candidatus Thermoplasmatota archaeon]
MATYIILSRISPQAFSNPGEFIQLAAQVSEKIKSECPGVTWKNSYATMGRFDVIDIVEADDQKEIEKLTMIIRAYGCSSTETLLATPWKEFLDIV